MPFFDMPPNQAIVQKVDDKRYAEEQRRLRRREEEARKRAVDAENRRKLAERQKVEKRNTR
jgi:hypothetical protein